MIRPRRCAPFARFIMAFTSPSCDAIRVGFAAAFLARHVFFVALAFMAAGPFGFAESGAGLLRVLAV